MWLPADERDMAKSRPVTDEMCVQEEVYEPLIGIQYPMLCSRLGDTWQIGTTSIREDQLIASGLRFVQ